MIMQYLRRLILLSIIYLIKFSEASGRPTSRDSTTISLRSIAVRNTYFRTHGDKPQGLLVKRGHNRISEPQLTPRAEAPSSRRGGSPRASPGPSRPSRSNDASPSHGRLLRSPSQPGLTPNVAGAAQPAVGPKSNGSHHVDPPSRVSTPHSPTSERLTHSSPPQSGTSGSNGSRTSLIDSPPSAMTRGLRRAEAWVRQNPVAATFSCIGVSGCILAGAGGAAFGTAATAGAKVAGANMLGIGGAGAMAGTIGTVAAAHNERTLSTESRRMLNAMSAQAVRAQEDPPPAQAMSSGTDNMELLPRPGSPGSRSDTRHGQRGTVL